MPASNRTAPPHDLNLPTGPLAGVKVSEQSWGIIYQGDKEALLAAGVLREEWMPRIPPGKKKSTGTTILPGGREVNVSRAGVKAKVLRVAHSFSEEEAALRRAKAEIVRQAEEAHVRAEREIASWPKDRADYARRLEQYGCTVLDALHRFAMSGIGGGYKVAPHSMAPITDAFAELVEAMRTAEITFDPEERRREEAKLRGKAASHDPAFGAFLDRVMEPPA